MADIDLPVADHLSELRRRILIALAALVAVSSIIYAKILIIVNFLMLPLGKYKMKLAFFSITEGFTTRIKLSLITGLIIISPIIIYHAIMFVLPALKKNEKKFVFKWCTVLSLLFLTGAVFGYMLLLPYSLAFMIQYGQGYMNAVLSGDRYFSLIGFFSLVTGCIFMLPAAIVILNRLGIINSRTLKKCRKYVVLTLLLAINLIIPSSDLIGFLALSLPLMLLYEAGIWSVALRERKLKKASG